MRVGVSDRKNTFPHINIYSVFIVYLSLLVMLLLNNALLINSQLLLVVVKTTVTFPIKKKSIELKTFVSILLKIVF